MLDMTVMLELGMRYEASASVTGGMELMETHGQEHVKT